MDLVSGRKVAKQQWNWQPFTDHLLRLDDITGLEGPAKTPSQFVPVDFLRLPEKVSTFTEAVEAMRTTDFLLMLAENQASAIKFCHFLKLAVLQQLFTRVLPPPLGPKSLARKERPASKQDLSRASAYIAI